MSASPLKQLACEIREQAVPASQQVHLDTLVSTLMTLSKQHDNREELAMAAIEACRQFHLGIWEDSASTRLELYASAEAELAALSAMLSPRLFQDLIEETARGHLRQRFPLVSANTVWDRLNAKPEISGTA